MKKSAVLMPNWIGDYVLALAVIIRKIDAGKGSAILIVPEKLVKLHKVLSDIPFIEYNRRNLFLYYKSIRKIREHFLNTFYLLPPSLSAAFLAFFCIVPHRRGINRNKRAFLLNDCLPGSVRDYKQHIINEYAAILETSPFLPQTWKGRYPKNFKKNGDKYIVFCPGASYGPAKQWPGYGKLAKMMSNYKILVLGSENDKTIALQICLEGGRHVHDLTGKTSFEQVVYYIANSQCVVSNDSGLMHIAGFIGKPVIGIFGSTDPAWTRPLSPESYIVSTGESCSPCFKRECLYGHYNCMSNISAAMIFENVERIIRI
jgi:heptosyltransferase-2